jgi:hypothetical protein
MSGSGNLQSAYYTYMSGGPPGSTFRLLPPVREMKSEEHTAFAPPTQDGLASLAANVNEAGGVAPSHHSAGTLLDRGTIADRLAHPLEYMMCRNSNSLAYEAFGSYSEYGGSQHSAGHSTKGSVQAMKRRCLEAQRDELRAELDRVDSHLARSRSTRSTASLASVSTASTKWYLIHRSKQTLAPSLSSSWTPADGPQLPKPATNLPKPGDFARVMAAAAQ